MRTCVREHKTGFVQNPDQEIIASLTRRSLRRVCHITPCDRLPSVFRHGGFLSFAERQARGISEADEQHYWGSVGKKEELAGFVICSFIPPWGMVNSHTEEMAIVTLASQVCARPGVCFCPANSAYSAFPASEIKRRRGIRAFDACFPNEITGWANTDAEILVPQIVPLTDFIEITFCDQEAAEYWIPQINAAAQEGPPSSDDRTIPSRLPRWDGFSFPPGWRPTRRIRYAN